MKPVKIKIIKPVKEKIEKPPKEPKRKRQKKEKKVVAEPHPNETNANDVISGEKNPKQESPVVVKKSAKAKVEKVIVENPNKRTSGRTRNKVVNYNEDDEEIGSQARLAREIMENDSELIDFEPVLPEIIPAVPETLPPQPTNEQSPSQRAPITNHMDHPPIVLRISKVSFFCVFILFFLVYMLKQDDSRFSTLLVVCFLRIRKYF